MSDLALPSTPGKEIRDISVKRADNGGYVLRYSIYTPAGAISESVWDDQTLVYGKDEKETMMADLSALVDKQL